MQATTATTAEDMVASTEGRKMAAGSLEPTAERTVMTPSGSTASPEVLMATKSAMELLATPG